MLTWNQFRIIRRQYFGEDVFKSKKSYKMYEKKMSKYCTDSECQGCDYPKEPFELAPLPKAVPSTKKSGWFGTKPDLIILDDVINEEGKTPMRNYNDVYASANVITAQSDTAVQREYLLNRLSRACFPKDNELFKLFNMDVDNTPKTYKELIDAIKNDKFSVDAKVQKRLDNLEDDQEPWYWGAMHGIIWEGKQPDPDGYSKALIAKDNHYTAAKDVIMGGVYTDGLKALQDFEAWLPTAATTTVQ